MKLNHSKITQSSAKHWHFKPGKLCADAKCWERTWHIRPLDFIRTLAHLRWIFWPDITAAILQTGKLRPRVVALLVLNHAVSPWQTQSWKSGIPASLFHSQISYCQSQVLHKTLQSCSAEWYITNKRGKDAPSVLVLGGLAASLIHSLQLHCWKRVQKEDQATRKQPQYLIWPDLAGRLLQLYICSSLTKRHWGFLFLLSLFVL